MDTDPSPSPSDTNQPARVRKYGGPNGYGHKDDPPGHMRTDVRHLIGAVCVTVAIAAVASQSSFSMRDAVLAGPGIMNQIQTSSCTGHAAVGAVETTIANRNRDADGKPSLPFAHRSPVCVYDFGRCIDRVPGTPLTDDGAMPNQIVRGITQWGICPYADRPTDMNTINDEPKMLEVEDAGAFRVSGEHGLTSTGTLRIQQMKQLLAAGYAICFAVDVDSKFEDYNGTGVVTVCDPNDDLGGHDLYLIGWRTNPTTGDFEPEFVNSWDVTWGDHGFGWGDSKFVESMQCLYVMSVTVITPKQAA